MKLIISIFLFISLAQAQLVQSVKPWLGIAIEEGKTGVRVKMSVQGTPARKAGLTTGDEVISIDGQAVKTPRELIKAVTNKGVGNETSVVFLRGGKKLTKKIVLEAKPDVEKVAKQKLMGEKAPDFELDVIQGRTEKKMNISDFKGKVTLLEFWSTSCGACISAHPSLMKFAQKNKGKINMVSISAEKKKDLKKFLGKVDKLLKNKERSVTFLNSDDGKVIIEYMARSIPMFVLLDKKGVVVDVGIGAGRIAKRMMLKAESLL